MNRSAENPMEARIQRLEEKLAFQDQEIEALNDALIDQQRDMDRLIEQLENMRVQLRSMAEAPVLENTPPPHY